MLGYIIVGISIAVIIKLLRTAEPLPVLGVYFQPGRWFHVKKWAFFLLYKLRQRQNKSKKNVTGQNAGYGVRSRNSPEDMDKVQDLPKEHPMAVDAVYFNGGNKDGYYFVGATARRHKDLVQTLLYLRIPDLGLLQLGTLPDTCLKASKSPAFAAGGLHIQPVDAMKKWKLSFDGNMKLIKAGDGSEETVKVRFELDWTADSRLFDFDTDMNVTALCEAMALERWSRDFFNNLRDAHQTHYEQFGTITGTVHIDNYPDKEISVRGIRDHSYGNYRDWTDLYRYGIQYISLQDGTGICVGNICFPKTMSRLIIGYVFHPDGRMDTVSSTDFELWKLGEDGNDPTHFTFNFTAGETVYELKGEVLDRPVFYMGEEWEARIVERMCSYTVNGQPGWGISEWDYRNHTGRPEEYKKKNQ